MRASHLTRGVVVTWLALTLALITGFVTETAKAGSGGFLKRAQAFKLFYTQGQADALFIGEPVSLHSTEEPVASGNLAFVDVQCPTGMRATGGGHYFSDQNLEANASYPTGTGTTAEGLNGWGVWAKSESSETATVTVYVVCVGA